VFNQSKISKINIKKIQNGFMIYNKKNVNLIAAFLNLINMKPNTYTKLYAHCVFTPKGRHSLLRDSVRENVHKYIYGIIKARNCYPVAINGTIDHIHILAGFRPSISIEDLVRDIKRSSALHINTNHLLAQKFSWQEGYGAFTVGYRELDIVYKYVFNQQTHHQKSSFKQEYLELLTDQGIDYSPEYLYEFYDED
jgi:REP element-mobilizing transposase RayT